MKKLLLFLSVWAVVLASCNKDRNTDTQIAQPPDVAHGTVVASGPLVFAHKTTTGSVKIYRQPNGRYQLMLEGVHLNAAHGLVIYLAPEGAVGAGSVKICSVPQINGTAFYALPAGFDPSRFTHLIIQTEPWEETVASAVLG